MQSLLNNPNFHADYEKLKAVKLNPARHTAATAHEHCEMVAARAAHLAALNGCTPSMRPLLSSSVADFSRAVVRGRTVS
ncbi:MAG: hypothetical protein K2R98_13500, partial [Gemmataceae bacterium]|nr:hypothetical protein [Gemmataceae bacterium]